jgi:cbb3-type cytochrome oxidase subunit 3
MKSELLAQSPLLALPMVALFVFIAVFAYVVWSAYRRKASAYDGVATLPLETSQEETSHE